MLAHRGEPRELIERAEAVLFKIGHDGGMAEMRTIEAVLHEEIDKLEELSRKRRRPHRHARPASRTSTTSPAASSPAT